MQRKKKRKIQPKKSFCRFCKDEKKYLDYKDVPTLSKLITAQGKILPRKRLGTCSRHQQQVKRAIKRARIMALLPFVQIV
ncbi:MAG: 30S ribosomal protein S18 [Planctomycetota bacterium]